MGVGYLAFTLIFPTLRSVYFEPLTFGEGFTFFDSTPLPAPVVALGVAALVVLLYAATVGREMEEGVEDGRTADAASVRMTSGSLGRGLRETYAGTRSYLAGFRDIDDPVAATKRPWDPRTAALGITVVALVWFVFHSIVGITGPESRWTAYLLQTTGFDAGSYEYWGSVMFAGEGVGVTSDMVMIAFVIVGAFAAAYWSGDFRLRVPRRRRLPNAVVGGLLMGFGSRIAPGCNIGNIYSGLASLSAHSFVAATGIILGVYVMTHWLYRDVGCAI